MKIKFDTYRLYPDQGVEVGCQYEGNKPLWLSKVTSAAY